jgi:SAM-dependent methyltransferase
MHPVSLSRRARLVGVEPLDDYLAINLANWNGRVPIHVQGYDLPRFEDPAFLSGVVTFDLPRLGDISGLDGVHLQCHIGTDTLSLARLGARMSGLDFSAPALEAAQNLAQRHGHVIDYVESDVYGAVEAFAGQQFDFVYTGIGALCWLPDIRRWAQVVSTLLRPGGFLFIREAHPVIWAMCDPRPDGLLVLEHPYFESTGSVWQNATTYVPHEGELEHQKTVEFNHGLAEIFNALWSAGLQLTLFEEHTSIPWAAFGDAMEVDEMGECTLRDRPERAPVSYTLRAAKG